MKSKRRILIGDCSGLYRKKGQKPINVNIKIPDQTRDQIIRALQNMSFGVDRASARRDQEVTGNSWFMIGDRLEPNEIRITQSDPPEEYRSNIPAHNHALYMSGGYVGSDLVRAEERIQRHAEEHSSPRHTNARHTITLETVDMGGG